MIKSAKISILFFCLTMLFSGCADTSNLEGALQIAQNESAALATENAELIDSNRREVAALETKSAEEANAASTRTALVLAEAQGAAEEAISGAEATSEAIAAAATLSSLPDVEYDTRCLLYTSPSPRDQRGSRMPSSA